MSVLQKLTEKSWLPAGADMGADLGMTAERRPAIAATGVWIYIGVATVIFSLVVAAYILRLGNYGADPAKSAELAAGLPWWNLAALCGIPPAEDWRPLSEPPLLWANTAILILSSLAWRKARAETRRGQARELRAALVAGGVLAFAFLAGQLVVWRVLAGEGHFAGAGPATAFFYLITAVHGLHLAGGMAFWGRIATRAFKGAPPNELATSIKLCAVYWHYLLLVWTVMFGLMLIT